MRPTVHIVIKPFRNRRGRVTGYTARCDAFTTTAKTPELAESQLLALLRIGADSLDVKP